MTRTPWTAADIDRLRALYPNRPTRELAVLFDRGIRAVYEKANQLGLKKTREFLASGLAGRLDGVRGGATRFKKGQVPANKGLKRPGWAPGHMAETQFKKGQTPHNTRAVGAYRITRDGYLQQKIGTAKGSNSKRWRGVHELVWIAAHGPLPPGHIVVFKPGMRTTELAEITLDKVECISLAENMRRNTRHNLPKELNEVIGLRAALVRKINHRTKTHEQRNDQRPA